MCFPLSGAALWTSFQDERRKLVEQMCDMESAMALVTTAKAGGIQQAEETCRRYKVQHPPTPKRIVNKMYILIHTVYMYICTDI